jgi:hypothetical protein
LACVQVIGAMLGILPFPGDAESDCIIPNSDVMSIIRPDSMI